MVAEAQPLKVKGVSVRLTPRQYGALRSYCRAVDAPMGAFVRALIIREVPPPYWDAEEPPPGQLRLGEE